MRLLNLNTLELKEFIDSARPPYVILSHTWEAEEVSLQELHGPNVQRMAGYSKILDFCRRGAENGFEWGWVDTCCIDKKSSAELSEAINSMYRWYQEAEVCYAFLCDVFSQQSTSIDEQFARSRWFTRGWTLQELLAPLSVVFYVRDWTVYGTRSSLQEAISNITGIPDTAMAYPITRLELYSVAQKLSWASRRQTTRPEDLSYCLLGLLGVHMPLLYGEGATAFIRLQEEIMKIGNDPTIFAWPSSEAQDQTVAPNSVSLLAPSPAAFKHAGNIGEMKSASYDHGYGPWSVTNRGLRIEHFPMIEGPQAKELLSSAGYDYLDFEHASTVPVVGLIYCSKLEMGLSVGQLGIALLRVGDIHYRLHTPESLLILDLGLRETTRKTCIVQHKPAWPHWKRRSDTIKPMYIVRKVPEKGHGFNLSRSRSLTKVHRRPGLPEYRTTSSLAPAGFGTLGKDEHMALEFSNETTKNCFVVVFGNQSGQPWADILTDITNVDLANIIDSYGSYLFPNFPNQWRRATALDRISKPLYDRKEIDVSIVRGVKNGEGVLFLDTSIRDESQGLSEGASAPAS